MQNVTVLRFLFLHTEYNATSEVSLCSLKWHRRHSCGLFYHTDRLHVSQSISRALKIKQKEGEGCVRVCAFVCVCVCVCVSERERERVADIPAHSIKTLNYFKYPSEAHLPP